MKQGDKGGKKKETNSPRSKGINSSSTKMSSTYECNKNKRRRTINGNVVLAEEIHPNRRWSSVGKDVEMDLLTEMGLGKLEEEIPDSLDNFEKEKISNGLSSNTSLTSKNSEDSVKSSAPVSNGKENPGDISDDFFLYRRSKPCRPVPEDLFNKLSDEVILGIFKNLPKKTLALCACVCKRWRQISYDESLWTRLDLGCKVLQAGQLEHVLTRGVVILRLSQADIRDPVFPETSRFMEDQFCKLQYLDLSMVCATDKGIAALLGSCNLLKKLSLEHCTLNDISCAAIGKNTDLDTLNLSGCYGISSCGINNILTGCTKLTSLNIAWNGLDVEAIEVICKMIPRVMQRLNMSGCRQNLSNEHVEELVSRCEHLMELDLSDSTALTADAVDSICALNKVEYLAFSRCYNIPSSAYKLLGTLRTLKYLDVYSLFQNQGIVNLQASLPHVEINKFLFSSVARPTVGIRRTSIWGLRVRD